MKNSSESLGEIDFIELGYKILSILFSLKKPLYYFFIFSIIIGFISTAFIQPKFEANTRILFKLPNENLKNEKNIDFSSLSTSAIRTEIEIMLSNALLHNVIQNNNISKPTYEISSDNSSIITRFANLIYQYTGLKFIIGLIFETSSSIKDTSISKGVDIALDIVVSSVDEEKVSDISNKILNEFTLSIKQKNDLTNLKEKFKNGSPDSEEVLGFAYGILESNNYSEADIVELAKKYLPESIKLSDQQLIKLFKRYKDSETISDHITNEINKDLPKKEFNSLEEDRENSNYFKMTNSSDEISDNLPKKEFNSLEENKENLNYFEMTNSSEFNLPLISWLRSNLKITKDKNSNIINVSFVSVDPIVSSLISNAVSNEYLQYQRTSKENAGLYTADYFQDRVNELKLTQLTLDDNILNFEKNNNFYDSKISNLEIEIKQNQNELRKLELDRNEKLETLRPEHPEMIKILGKEKSLNDYNTILSNQVTETRSARSLLSSLIAEKNVNDKLIETYLNRLLSVSSFNQSDAKIIEGAKFAKLTSGNDAIKKLFISIMYFVFVSFIFILFIIVKDLIAIKYKIQFNSQIKDICGYDNSGIITNIKITQKLINKNFLKEDKILLDHIKKIFKNIKKNNSLKSKVYSILSASSTEGKTMVTMLLASYAKMLSKKVLLIDMDYKKKSLSNLLGIKSDTPGLSNYLLSKETRFNYSKYVSKSKIGHDILSAGNSDDINDLIGTSKSKKIENLIKNLSKKYDYIFCDTMPILYQSEILSILSFTNNILITRHNYTSISLIRATMHDIRKNELQNPHIILNDVDIQSLRIFRLSQFEFNKSESSYDDTYGYGYGYGNGYGYGYGYGHAGYGNGNSLEHVDNKTMKIFNEVVQKKILSIQKIFFNIVKVTKNLHIKSFLRNIYKKSLNFIEKI